MCRELSQLPLEMWSYCLCMRLLKHLCLPNARLKISQSPGLLPTFGEKLFYPSNSAEAAGL